MRIAIGSTRRPKVDAVHVTFRRLAPQFDIPYSEMEFLCVEAPSGVDETPRSLEHLMDGARNRVRSVLADISARNEAVDLAVGLEGGLWRTDHMVFLQSWACVGDGSVESFGSSGAILVPDNIAGAVLERGESLADVIDRCAGEENVRSRQGTWGVLTKDLVTRQESFECALVNALAPFYNRPFYSARGSRE